MAQYRVIVTVQCPAWNEQGGIVFVVDADSKREAIARARRINERGGQVHSQQGRAVWRAEAL